MSVLAQAWQAGREARTRNPNYRPVLLRLALILIGLVKLAGRRLPTWQRIRTAALQTAGLGLLDLAAFEWNLIVGLAATGISLLILEALGDDR